VSHERCHPHPGSHRARRSQAAEKLLPLVYDELRRLAAEKMREEKPGQTLQATALVHEAYLRLVGSETRRTYRDRSHFFASAATAIRRILVDGARAKRSDKRGGGRHRERLEDMAAPLPDDELLHCTRRSASWLSKTRLRHNWLSFATLGVDGRPGGRRSGNLSQLGGSPLGVCAGLAANRGPRPLRQKPQIL